MAQPVIQPQAKIELNLAPTPKPALAPTPMVTEENVKIVKFKVKNKGNLWGLNFRKSFYLLEFYLF